MFRPISARHRAAVTLAILAGFASGSARAQQPSPDDRAVALAQMATQGEGVPPAAELAASVRRGLQAAGLTVSQAGPAPSADGCDDASCLRALSATHRAPYLAFARVQSGPQRYDIDIRLVVAATGENLSTDTVSCKVDDLCPPMPQTIQRLAKEAGRKAKTRIAELPLVTEAEPTAEFAPPRIYDTDASAKGAPQRPAWLPWVLGVGGTAALTTGGLVLAAHKTCEQPSETCSVRSYAGLGWGLSAVGFASVALALGLWLSEGPAAEAKSSSLALSGWVHPGQAGVSLAGRWK